MLSIVENVDRIGPKYIADRKRNWHKCLGDSSALFYQIRIHIVYDQPAPLLFGLKCQDRPIAEENCSGLGSQGAEKMQKEPEERGPASRDGAHVHFVISF